MSDPSSAPLLPLADRGTTLSETTVKTLKLTITSSPVNWFLIFVPLGILVDKLHMSATWVFTLNFLGIIPLASVLAYATEELGESIHNNSIAGLMNATFGNAVEVIVSIIALRQNQITMVQASMLGSILSNLLLVLGCCFVVGGLRYKSQVFNQTVAQAMSSLLALSVIGLLLPAAFHASLPSKTDGLDSKVLEFSRFTAVILLLAYCLYLVFQLKTHKSLFEDAEAETPEVGVTASASEDGVTLLTAESLEEGATSITSSHTAAHRGSFISKPKSMYDLTEDGEKAHLGPVSASLVLLLTTILVSVCADYLVSSIDDIVETSGLSKTFIGLIVIPIVGNAAEHVTAVVVAWKNKMDLAIGVAIGSSIQIALFVTPLLVIIGWISDVDMSLFFSTYETAVLFVSVFLTNYLIVDGESNWLEGAMLLCTYAIIGISFYFYPDTLAQ